MLPGSPRIGGSSPAPGSQMQAPGMQMQASQQGTAGSSSGQPSANTSPAQHKLANPNQGGNGGGATTNSKKRRASTIKTEDDGPLNHSTPGSAPTPAGTGSVVNTPQINGIQVAAKAKPPTPQMQRKRLKQNSQQA